MSNSNVGRTSRIGSTITVRTIAVHVGLYGVAFLFLLPYIYMLSLSLQPESIAISSTPHLIPPKITFANYTALLDGSLIVPWVINTFIVATVATVLVLIVDSMIAFSLTRLDWPGQSILLSIIVASFLVPFYVNLVPLFTIVADLGLVSSLLGVILPAVANPLGVFLLYQFFRDIPDEYDEAARLDGFSNFQIYAHIILPISKPILSALAIFVFVFNWNQFVWPVVVLQSQSSFTLPLGLVVLRDTFTFQPGLTMASGVIAALPLFILFLLLQDRIIEAVQFQGATG
ncbi:MULTISPECIES: carbohydrate ABC transporter permease [unclassified Haladaptatus]|uniref:carbohydrate ABC transporter permease n=1 Tax=unclassified Haladaptatus TaxID=2622732 RepID=UPI00209C3FD0|nr:MULTISPECIES: carbohydrate ABC transporter permease [unclassified Haladaptatus]MCO8243394.1 carbohydrate ABC transporter permease [Haladaptatus sp. AB643]MCO8254801.1 carbohydrate ABC transporter permease [Haladaptatus sp. AB618]